MPLYSLHSAQVLTLGSHSHRQFYAAACDIASLYLTLSKLTFFAILPPALRSRLPLAERDFVIKFDSRRHYGHLLSRYCSSLYTVLRRIYFVSEDMRSLHEI
jgi:hypothetical protein